MKKIGQLHWLIQNFESTARNLESCLSLGKRGPNWD